MFITTHLMVGVFVFNGIKLFCEDKFEMLLGGG